MMPSTKTNNITFKATAPQAEFLAKTCRYPAFVGGFGSGKTETMLNQALIDASHAGDAIIALYEPTYDLVSLMLMPRMIEKLELLGVGYEANKQEHTIKTKSSQFGNFIFRSLDKPEKIIAYESYTAHVDELDTLPTEHARDAWRKILGRNRQVPKLLHDSKKIKSSTGNLEAYNRAYAYTTPEGFRFVYDRWSARANEDYQLVRATTTSNPFNPEGYEESLRQEYPPQLAEAYINGEFVNLTSGTVYSSYNRVSHRSNETIKPSDPLFIGCDFNVGKMAATVYVKRFGGNQWHAVAELKDMRDTFDLIDVIKDRWQSKGHRIVIYPDASGASNKTNAAASDIALLEQAGFEVRAKKKNPAVADRVAATNKGFNNRQLFVNDRECPTVANCLEQQAYNKDGEPDKKSGHDHQNDATTYPIAYEMPIRKPVFAVDFSFVV